jgi:Fe-S-cluster containining protein
VASSLNIEPEYSASDDPGQGARLQRLCNDCGLCCNGVLFRTVALQRQDSATELAALGLKLKRKQGRHFIVQPCPALQGLRCSIYVDRPERCRRFECLQLKRLRGGEITETVARERIREAQRRVERLHHLLREAGKVNWKHPLAKRYEKVMAEPMDASANPKTQARRKMLTLAMTELDTLLDTEFRVSPDPEPPIKTAPPPAAG